jgi:hypothetical protein
LLLGGTHSGPFKEEKYRRMGTRNPSPYFSIVSHQYAQPQLCLVEWVRVDESFEAIDVWKSMHIRPTADWWYRCYDYSEDPD